MTTDELRAMFASSPELLEAARQLPEEVRFVESDAPIEVTPEMLQPGYVPPGYRAEPELHAGLDDLGPSARMPMWLMIVVLGLMAWGFTATLAVLMVAVWRKVFE